MTQEQDNLAALERLLAEFFEANTSNERKRQIEEQLGHFSQQEDAWSHCLRFIGSTSSQHVMMYCFTVLENVINRQWCRLSEPNHQVMRGTVSSYLLNAFSKAPTFITNKLAKLQVDIGRMDWPLSYPDFYSDILKLVQDADTVLLGLTLLEACSMELAQPQEDILRAERKEELNTLLLQQMPYTLNVLTNLLDSVLEKHKLLQTATPPSSPSGQHQGTSSSVLSSPAYRGDLISNMFNTPTKKIMGRSLMPLDEPSYKICLHTLRCVSELFSWIPLSAMITPTLLSTIFHFATFGCEAAHKVVVAGTPTSNSQLGPMGSGSDGGSAHQRHQRLGLLAMGCINELLAKNCVPSDFENFLLQMFQQTFYLLQKLTSQSSSAVQSNRLRELDESFVDKFTEFLRLFVNHHLRRFESNDQFPVMDFLSLLFQYTFQQPSLDGFYSCLDIWTIFLDYLSTSIQNRTSNSAPLLNKYRDGLFSFTQELLKKMQFKFNQAELDSLDDESPMDDGFTEWQMFLKSSNGILTKLAELLPVEVFKLTFTVFAENMDVYIGLNRFITATANGHTLSIQQESDCSRLHCALRDLSTFLQCLGCYSGMVIGAEFRSRLQESIALLDRLIQMAEFNSKTRLYEASATTNSVLRHDFVETCAQTLATLKTYCPWASQLHLESMQAGEKNPASNVMVTSMAEATICLLDPKTPSKISHSASHLLLSLLTSVRPRFLLQSPFVEKMYSGFCQGLHLSCSMEMYLLVSRALSSFLILRWPACHDGEQQWEQRAALHKDFIGRLLATFLQLSSDRLAQNEALFNEAKPMIRRSLKCLTYLVECIAGETKKTKDICYASIERHIHCANTLFPLYMGDAGVLEEIVTFFHTLINGLRIQMGVAYNEELIRRFMGLFTKERLEQLIGHQGNMTSSSSEVVVVEKFLAMLQQIVEEPGASFKAFVPQVLSICLDHVFPIVAKSPSPDVKVPLYCLLCSILTHNWKYFFKDSVLHNLGATKGTEITHHEQEFVATMQAFGVSFLQPDITVFRGNLEALEKLNDSWKLYQKPVFREKLMPKFLTVLLQTLLAKSHDLLQEEIILTLYNMAAVDMAYFLSRFLPQFVDSFEGIDTANKRTLTSGIKFTDTDLPSFTMNIRRLANDMRYYQTLYAHLPAGAVSLTT